MPFRLYICLKYSDIQCSSQKEINGKLSSKTVAGWCWGPHCHWGPHHHGGWCLMIVVGEAALCFSTCKVPFCVGVSAWQGGLEFH